MLDGLLPSRRLQVPLARSRATEPQATSTKQKEDEKLVVWICLLCKGEGAKDRERRFTQSGVCAHISSRRQAPRLSCFDECYSLWSQRHELERSQLREGIHYARV
jgi:hypothetical protein